MKTHLIRMVVAVAAMIATTSLAIAGDIRAGDLLLTGLWSRATPSGAKVAAAYLTIENKGATADRLVGATSPVAKAEVHEMTMANGVMTMRPVEAGLAIAPGQKVTLAPNGYHLMLTDLTTPLKQGDTLHVTLTFEKAGSVDASFLVGSVGAQGPGDGKGAGNKPAPDHMNMKGMDHSGMKM